MSSRGSRLAVLGVLWVAASTGTALAEEGALYCDDLSYVENVYLTTDYGPAPADIVLGEDSFLECTRGEYALCYYSGAEPMPCTMGEDGVADCVCQVFEATPENPMYVAINDILNTCVYIETATQCGQDGANCPSRGNPGAGAADNPTAKVCEYIARGTFDKKADYISTFSLQKVTAPTGEAMKLGCHDCETPATYAGCMTASCHGLREVDGRRYTTCRCPTFDGPFQFGRRQGTSCSLEYGRVWSAAYDPEGCATP